MAKAMKPNTPEEQQIINATKQFMKQHHGITDEDFERHISYPANRKMILRKQELDKYKIVAEVIESKYCGAGIEVGQKYIFQGIPNLLLINESDCPLCVKAIGPVSELMHGFWDRIIEGADPNEGMWLYARCLDMGVKYGGLGSVIFRVYAQKIA